VGAVIAGQILARASGSEGFGYSLLIACGLLVISWLFLAATREPSTPMPVEVEGLKRPRTTEIMRLIMRQDSHFRWFLAGRLFSMVALTGYAFYTVYAVSKLGVSAAEIGVMTGVLMAAQLVANVGMGWLGDHWEHRPVMVVGLLSLGLSALLAWWAPSSGWFYLVFILTALGNVAIWTIGMAMTLEFGREEERPLYIGLSSTLLAPVNILAPFIGGWVAAGFGYPAVFLLSAVAGLAAAGIFQLLVPRHKPQVKVSFLDERRSV
jgi:MFS family permease